MATIPYVEPGFRKPAFNCPFCLAYANQHWEDACYYGDGFNSIRELKVAYCTHCQKYSVWRDARMIHPPRMSSPLGHPDMPETVKSDYDEARSIAASSPRSAAALLRLCIQKLCKELGESGKNINQDIGDLVAKGLPVKVQQALDIVRVVGNEQVHPGTLDIRDDPGVANELFVLVNFIVENQIAQPKAIEELYGRLPDTKRKAIEERDAVKDGEVAVP